ncbi:metallophosphoesterase [Tessaracoccus sp. SD287]|uniref:metallophosphoesterase family protein n=1 Tax=Tessaracoccus sp. SD287 TaxID=2782008 RepID=UPI001A960793|nr:metallophosphoesterase [Tessaracoccus sp. SD287]MBO1030944.1 metallophosphoesterase [Tessaracoccus sp. SD287]
MRILHVSDLHLAGDAAWHYGKVDTAARLVELLDGLELASLPADRRPQVVVVSGDISNDDSAQSYDLALELVGARVAGLGVPVVWAPGNHDNGAHYDRLHQPHGAVAHHARGVVTVPGGAVAVVDTRTPRRGFGQLPQEFDGLLHELASVDGERVLVMHHPPVPAPTALHHALRLRGAEVWAEKVAASGVSLVLSGHYHLPGVHRWGRVPVVVGAAVANLTDPAAAWAEESALAVHGLTLVDSRDPAAARFVRIGAAEPSQVFRMDAERVRVVASWAGNPEEADGGMDDTGRARELAEVWRRHRPVGW